MKTISDIRENVELLHTMDRHARMESERKYKDKIFKYYDDVPEINKLITDLENHQNGYYQFDQFGDFVYSIDVPKDIQSLPNIGDFLARDFGWYKDGVLSQFLGDPITINYRDPRSYFVFDHDRQKPIIEDRLKHNGHTEVTEENYIRAKIEHYMRSLGVYPDVVLVDFYGGYQSHFDMRFPGKPENLEITTDEELLTMIDLYEQHWDE